MWMWLGGKVGVQLSACSWKEKVSEDFGGVFGSAWQEGAALLETALKWSVQGLRRGMTTAGLALGCPSSAAASEL